MRLRRSVSTSYVTRRSAACRHVFGLQPLAAHTIGGPLFSPGFDAQIGASHRDRFGGQRDLEGTGRPLQDQVHSQGVGTIRLAMLQEPLRKDLCAKAFLSPGTTYVLQTVLCPRAQRFGCYVPLASRISLNTWSFARSIRLMRTPRWSCCSTARFTWYLSTPILKQGKE